MLRMKIHARSILVPPTISSYFIIVPFIDATLIYQN